MWGDTLAPHGDADQQSALNRMLQRNALTHTFKYSHLNITQQAVSDLSGEENQIAIDITSFFKDGRA